MLLYVLQAELTNLENKATEVLKDYAHAQVGAEHVMIHNRSKIIKHLLYLWGWIPNSEQHL